MLRNPRTRILISLLMLTAVIFGWRLWRGGRADQAEASEEAVVQVVTAAYAIAPRVVVDRSMVTLTELPDSQWQAWDEETRAEIVRRPEEVVGRVVTRGIPAGGVLRSSALVPFALVTRIPPGMRAMVLPAGAAPTHYHTNLLRVGDRVDIAATFNQNYARLLLENVEVLAIDRALTPDPSLEEAGEAGGAKAPAITVAVSPRQASIMALALEADPDLEFLVRPLEAPELLDLQIATTASPDEGVTLEEIAPLRHRDPQQWQSEREAERRRYLEERRKRLELEAQLRQRRSSSPPPAAADLGTMLESVMNVVAARGALPPASPQEVEEVPAPPPPPGVYLIRGNQIERVVLGQP